MDQFGPEIAGLLGILEGLTEFLPVSSTGHLILLGEWLGFTGDMAISVEICLQLGAILAIMAYERHKIFSILQRAYIEQQIFCQNLTQSHRTSWVRDWGRFLHQSFQEHRSFWFLIGIGAAFMPAAVVGLLAHDWIELNLFSAKTVAYGLIIGGIIIFIVESLPKTTKYFKLEQIGLPAAVGVGVAQCVALIPGMSRSGSTIVGGLLLGLDRKVATEFSFFLALPTMIAATGYKFLDSYHLFNAQDTLALVFGMVVSFFVAWAVIASFLAFVKHYTLRVFGYYRVVLGISILSLI